jgi:hypothetical protein
MLIRIPPFRQRHLLVDESKNFWDGIKRNDGEYDYEDESDADPEEDDDDGEDYDEDGEDDGDDEEGSIHDGTVHVKVEAAS